MAQVILGEGAAGHGALRRVHALLQLLADAHAAAAVAGAGQGGFGVSAGVEQVLRQLRMALREEGSSSGGGEERGGGGGARGHRKHDEGSSGGEGAGGSESKLHGTSSGDLERRLWRQLQPACLRLLKQVLAPLGSGGGGKTD